MSAARFVQVSPFSSGWHAERAEQREGVEEGPSRLTMPSGRNGVDENAAHLHVPYTNERFAPTPPV